MNTMKALTAAVLLSPLISPLSALAVPMVVTDYTDLDFTGDFVYALNFNGSGSHTVGDAAFTNVSANGSGAPTGVSVSGFDQNLTWGGASNLGTGADNDALESIMSSIIWSRLLDPGAIDLSVTTGTDYKLQLLFSERSNNQRHFDVRAENGAFQDEVAGTDVGGSVWINSSTQGYAMTWDFTAQDSLLDIDFNRFSLNGDTNYLISGLTLERTSVPEPGSLGLLAAGVS